MNKENNIDMPPLDLVFVTTVEHLYTLSLSIKRLTRLYEFTNIHIVTSKKNIRYFSHLKTICGHVPLRMIDEDTVLPDMTLEKLREINAPCFPKRAGWYLQQFLKLGVSDLDSISENYLVVDADTIFLRKVPLMDQSNRYLFTKSKEYHLPYFTNYSLLLNEEPNREFSFISQYMIFNKHFVKEMLARIEGNFHGSEPWYWAIVKNMNGDHASLFSEYETYGHYMKNNHPERCAYLDILWHRIESNDLSSYFPKEKHINAIPNEFHYVSFEQRAATISGKIIKRLCGNVIPHVLCLAHRLRR